MRRLTLSPLAAFVTVPRLMSKYSVFSSTPSTFKGMVKYVFWEDAVLASPALMVIVPVALVFGAV